MCLLYINNKHYASFLQAFNINFLSLLPVTLYVQSFKYSKNFSIFVGIFLGVFAVQAYPNLGGTANLPAVVSTGTYSSQTSHEEAIINAVKNASDSVVSVVISKEVPVYKKVDGWVS